MEELRHALKKSKEHGVLNQDEADLAAGYVKLEEATVKELMRPREEVLFFKIEEPLSRLIALFVDEECSRIPVVREGMDGVIGIITSRLFFYIARLLKQQETLFLF